MNFKVDESWQEIIDISLTSLDKEYLEFLKKDTSFFPDKNSFLNAFKTLKLENTKYILFGQDPYPREKSAVGYAFIDGNVDKIFSATGLSKEVNKATSLRNFMKMLLRCGGLLKDDFSQSKIADIDKTDYIDSIDELRKNFEKNGVLLLNMALVFTAKSDSKKHIREFKPFILSVLGQLQDSDVKLILLGNWAKSLTKMDIIKNFESIEFQHPYNTNFITDLGVCEFFGELNLLKKVNFEITDENK